MTKMYYNGQIVDVDDNALKSRTYSDLAPVKTTQDVAPVNQKKKKKKFNLDDWLDLKNFKDGYDFGDITKSILGTGTKVSQNFAKGAQSNLEGILDAGANYLSMGTEKLGMKKATKDLRKFAQEDFIDKHDLANKALINVNPVMSLLNQGIKTKEKLSDGYDFGDIITSIPSADLLGTEKSTLSKKMDKMAENSITGVKTDELSQTVGQIAGQSALTSVGLPWQVTAFASSAGNEMNEAFQNNATASQAFVSGLISGVAEVGSEYVGFGGDKLLGMESLGGKAISKLGSKISNKVLQYVTKMGLGAVSEGLEEVLSGYGSAIGKWLTYMNDKEINEIYSNEEALDEFVMGALGTLVTNIPGTARSIARGENAYTGLTENEQTVLEEEVQRRTEQESKGKELTKKQIDKIREGAIKDFQKGYIDANQIEKTLGEKYNPEKDIMLNESFAERERRSIAYENKNLDKYSEGEQKIIKKAIKSGILNNTNKTHDMVDLIAKLSSEKGIDFDFTNNENLKKSSFAVDGKTIDGFVDGKKITLNIESNKALNKIVGHEITHILEGTELYNSLQDSLKSYLGEKEWNSRLSEIEKRYENVKNANATQELTADLVGDYIFNDADFVRNLSTKNPNLFQKVYNEIKYMLKIATTGSQQEKELEKAKHIFEEMYKENVKGKQGEKLSLSEMDEAKRLQKELTQAKTNLTKKENAFKMANSEEHTYQDENFAPEVARAHRAELREKTTKAHDEYVDAQERLENAQKAIDDFKTEQTKGLDEDIAFSLSNIKGENNDYGIGVKLDTDFFKGVKPRNWGNKVNKFVYNNLAGKTIDVINENGKTEQISFAKANERVTKDGSKNNHRVIDKLARNNNNSRALAIIQVDELLQASKDSGNNNQHTHQWLDENGWSFKKVYLEDIKNNIYEAKLNIAKASDGRNILYDIQTKKVDDANLLSNRSSASTSTSDSNIPQNTQNDKFSLSEEVNNDSLSSTNEVKYSISEAPTQDNKGRELSKQQQEYFKDSKVRDEEGKLLPVYHGTSEEINVFDKSRLGSNTKAMSANEGFFFVENKHVAEEYSRYSRPQYLQELENEYQRLEKIAQQKQTKEAWGAYEDAYLKYEDAELSYAYDTDGVRSKAENQKEVYLNLVNPLVHDFKGEGYRDVSYYDLLVEAKEKGHDGAIFKNTYDGYGEHDTFDNPKTNIYVAFESNQIKNVDNMNPTSDVDTRLSLSNQNDIAPTGGWEIKGKDIMLEDALAPIKEQMKSIEQSLEQVRLGLSAKEMENDINNGELDLNNMTLDEDIANFNPEDIDVSPFLEGLEKAEENQNKRKELKKQIEEKKSTYIPKDSSSGRGWRSFLRLFENEFAPIDQMAKDRNNPEIKHKADTYNNWVALASSNMTNSQTDINGNPIGRSGNSIIEEANKLGLGKVLDTYVKHWSNIDRARQNKGGADYSSKESYKIVKQIEAEHPEVKRLASDVWNYFRNARHNLRDAGIINEDLSKRLGRMYPHYVPYVSENVEQYFNENGELKPVKTIKSAKGGAVIGDLLSLQEALQRYTYSEYKGIKFNELAKEIIKSSNDEVRLEPDTRNSYVDADQLYVDKDGYYLTAYENGEPISTRINKEIYDTLSRNLNQQIKDLERQWSPVTKPLQWLSNLRRNLLTKYSPSFMLSNPIRDIGDAVVNSKYSTDFIKHYTNPSNLLELATNKGNAPQFKNLYGVANDMGQFNVDSGLFEANKDAKNFNFLKGVENINEILELAPRYAEFQASLDNGCSIEEAMYNAREVTTNFSRGGVITKALNRNGMTFLNASVQGLSKFIRNFSGENGAKGVVSSLAKAIIFGVAPSIFNDLAFGWGDDKDEDYEALPDYIKDNYYLIKMSNGEFFRIPKGRMISVFGSAGRRALEYLNGEEDAFEGFLKNADSQIGINNPEENNLFAPLIQAFGSKNGKAWYGDDIVPTRLQNVPEAEQYDEKIDDFSIWLGEKTGISPYKLNYVLDQYSGPIGDVFLPMTTKEATSDADSIGDYLIAPVKDKFIVDSTTDNKYVGDFYSTNEKLNTQANSMYATDEDILKKDYMNSISRQMSQLYAERREIQSDTTLSNKEKFAKSQAIKDQINKLAKEGIDGYENINITGNYAEVDNNVSYYKNANGKWTSIGEDDMLATAGLTDLQKSKYYDVKNDLYEVNKEYSEKYETASDVERTQLSKQKKQDTINIIKTSGLPDDVKANIYRKKYNDDLIEPLTSAGMSVNSYLDFKSQTFTADKNAKGQSISGSKKKKVFDYVNQMNIPFIQKAMLIKSEYKTYNTYNYQILEYIKKSNLSYDEKLELLKRLGFTIDGSKVSW